MMGAGADDGDSLDSDSDDLILDGDNAEEEDDDSEDDELEVGKDQGAAGRGGIGRCHRRNSRAGQ
jgi:hypothetical protein